MKEFPQKLHVNNKSEFHSIYLCRVTCYLRRDIYEHMLHQDENSYFDIEKFMKSYHIEEKDSTEIVKNITKELTKLGWKCKLSFGDTGLFIYSTENPPPSCWDSDL